MTTPALEQIIVYPIKSLDAHGTLDCVEVRSNGGLSYDREFAIVDESGGYVNGKNDRRVHELRSHFDPDAGTLTLQPNEDERVVFDTDNRGQIASWLSEYFDQSVELRQNEIGGFPDDTLASGPTLISKATIETVANWFEGIDAAEMKRRLRPNLVVSGVKPFWEDQLYDDDETTVAFRIGDCEFVGSNPCQRCVVPTRDPDTGVKTSGFRETFVEKRQETLPEWASTDWYDHYFRLMVNTFVPRATVGESICVGDEIELLGERPYPA